MKKIVLLFVIMFSLFLASCFNTNSYDRFQYDFQLKSDDTYLVDAHNTETSGELTIPSEYNGKRISEVGGSSYKSSSITKLIIPDNIEIISSSAFYECYDLMCVVIGKNVKTIEDSTFKECNRIVEVYNLSEIELNPDSNLCKNAIVIHKSLDEESIISIKNNDFYFASNNNKNYLINAKNDSAGNNVVTTLPNDIEYEIYNYAFANRKFNNMAVLEIPSVVSKIGKYAFYRATLGKVKFNEGLTYIGDSAFENCPGLIIDSIPKSLKYIGSRAFLTCINVGNLVLDDVEYLGDYAFYGTNQTINKIFVKDNIINDNEYASINFSNPNVVIPDGVTWIGKNAFANSNIETLVIPASVKTISARAFYDCSVKEVIIEGDLEIIGEEAFSTCLSLEKVTIKSVKILDNKCFYWCQRLKSISFGDVTTKIGDNAFDRCENLSEIKIPNTIKEIGVRAFAGCLGAETIDLKDSSLERIEDNTFTGWINLKTIILPKSITYIGVSAFEGASFLEDINLGDLDLLTVINDKAFNLCQHLKEIILPINVKEIGSNAFYCCLNVSEIVFNSNIEKIAFDAFDNFRPSSVERYEIFDRIDTIEKLLVELNPYNEYTNTELNLPTPNIYLPFSYSKFLNLFTYSPVYYNRYSFGIFVAKPNFYVLDDNGDIIYNNQKYMLVDDDISVDIEKISIGSFAYRTLNKLEITNVKEIDIAAFYNSTIKNLYFNGTIDDWSRLNVHELANFISEDTIVYLKDENTNEYVLLKDIDKKVITIGNNVKAIFDYQFKNLKSLRTVIFEGDLLYIGKEAFMGCTSLDKVDIKGNVKIIQEAAFKDCDWICYLIVNQVMKLGKKAFENTRVDSIFMYNLEGYIAYVSGDIEDKTMLRKANLYFYTEISPDKIEDKKRFNDYKEFSPWWWCFKDGEIYIWPKEE